MPMIPIAALAAALLVGPPAPPAALRGPVVAPADSAIQTVFYRELSVFVEVAGLKRWTPKMIADSMASKTGGAFWRQGCKDKPQRDLAIFPQSVAIQVLGDSAVTVFAAVIEPQDSGLVTVRKFGAP